KNGVGCIPFSPLAQGLLTDKYLNGIPPLSRASKENTFLKPENITADKIDRIKKLNAIAQERNQSLAQMALAWILRRKEITTVLIGASKPEQVLDSIKCLDNLDFSKDELQKIEKILNKKVKT